MVPPALANQPVRVYPLRVISEPGVYVAGEKQGQKVFPGMGGQGMAMAGTMGQSMGMGMGAVSMHPSAGAGVPGSGPGQGGTGPAGGGLPGAGGVGGPPTMVPSVGGTVGSGLPGGLPVGGGGAVPGAGGGVPGSGAPVGGVGGPSSSSSGMGLGMNLSNMSIHQQHALLAQQNSQMEALERRRERERAAAAAQQAQVGSFFVGIFYLLICFHFSVSTKQRPHPRLPDEDDSGGGCMKPYLVIHRLIPRINRRNRPNFNPNNRTCTIQTKP